MQDSYAYYYYRRGKSEAALDCAERAMRVHARMAEWAHVAKSQLHCACVLSRLGRRDEAVRCNAQVGQNRTLDDNRDSLSRHTNVDPAPGFAACGKRPP